MSDGLLLRGLDGANPLAFLAALGTLRTLSLALPGEKVRMRWEQADGAWRPRVFCSFDGDLVSLAGAVFSVLRPPLATPWTLDSKLPFAATKYREAARRVAACSDLAARQSADFMTALGTEAFMDDKGCFADTNLRMVRSGDAAGQGLLHYARKVAEATTEIDVRLALAATWTYTERGSSFRWDPIEDRKYALQAEDPGGEKMLSVIGANRLALEALPAFPVVATEGGASTVGFHRSNTKAEIEFRWPLWAYPTGWRIVSSLVAHPCLDNPGESLKAWIPIGICAIFASRQVRPNQYYRNFSPARQL